MIVRRCGIYRFSGAEPSGAERSRAEPSGAERSRAEPNRTEPNNNTNSCVIIHNYS
jgi:hypothetical protein